MTLKSTPTPHEEIRTADVLSDVDIAKFQFVRQQTDVRAILSVEGSQGAERRWEMSGNGH
jgi:hypothetical protein